MIQSRWNTLTSITNDSYYKRYKDSYKQNSQIINELPIIFTSVFVNKNHKVPLILI